MSVDVEPNIELNNKKMEYLQPNVRFLNREDFIEFVSPMKTQVSGVTFRVNVRVRVRYLTHVHRDVPYCS